MISENSDSIAIKFADFSSSISIILLNLINQVSIFVYIRYFGIKAEIKIIKLKNNKSNLTKIHQFHHLGHLFPVEISSDEVPAAVI